MALSACIELNPAHRQQLLAIARDSIATGLREGRSLCVSLQDFPEVFQAQRGVFVTLTQRDALRGCIGSMQSSDPLAQAVADSAFAAAFRDPRFPQLAQYEFEQTRVEISILSAMEPVEAADRASLLARLSPGADGILLEEGHHRSTFLPKVWEQLPDPERFFDQLLAKAGLPQGHWSSALRFWRYSTLCFSDAPGNGTI